MTDYQKYINALRKCAKEHENDRTSTGHIIVSDLCRDTANLLESLEQEPTTKNFGVEECISKQAALDACHNFAIGILDDYYKKCLKQWIIALPSVTPQEPILDKIRAEIDIARFIDRDTKLCKNANASGLEVALQIIDKYKSESEPQESEDNK